MSNDPIPSAHDAEAPPGEGQDSPGKGSVGGSPGKVRPSPGTLEWARQRKDNHKEVERRRRGNINEGINELSRIIPIGQGDKAKGAVLQRAVAYIHQLKDAEQRNVEKWTMEKLTNDQIVSDWQRRYSELEEKLGEERARREELEGEVTRMRRLLGGTAFGGPVGGPVGGLGGLGGEAADMEEDELEEDEAEDDEERPTKRQRVS